jgi:uncharacterized damage-inducible protein DinB
MSERIARTLIRLVDDAVWGSPWHKLEEAVSDLTDEGLDYRPVAGCTGPWDSEMARPARYGARAIFRHLIGSTLEAAELLPPGLVSCDITWAHLEPFDWQSDVGDLVRGADIALRQARDRAAAVTDETLWETCAASGALAGFSNAEVIVQCLVLHTPWHLGQLAVIPKWLRMGGGRPAEPAAPGGPESFTPCGEQPFHIAPAASDRDLLLEILRQAQEGCPWHAFERVIEGLGDEEAAWKHHPDTEADNAFPIVSYCEHVAACDVIYADMAFGERRADWRWAGEVIGGGPALDVSRRGYNFLVERVAGATEEQLEAVHTMHHGHDMTGWQVVACMIQHRLWHGGQIALIRDAYTGCA